MSDALSLLVESAEKLASAAANFYCYRRQYHEIPQVAFYLRTAKTLIADAENKLGVNQCHEGDSAQPWDAYQ